MRRGAIRLAIATLGAIALSACSSGGSSGGSTAVTVTSASPSSGSTLGGTAVVISGTNFESGATVKFGTAQATFVGFNTATSLSASTPPGEPGLVNVTVTNPDGTTGELVNGFTFVAPGCTIPAAVTSSLTLDAGCVWSVPVTAVVGGAANPVLTIGPGTTVEFANGTALIVGLTEPGSLVAQGTSSSGIIFTSATTSPVAGDWGGL